MFFIDVIQCMHPFNAALVLGDVSFEIGKVTYSHQFYVIIARMR